MLQGEVRVKGWGCRDVRGRADLLHMKAAAHHLSSGGQSSMRPPRVRSPPPGISAAPHICVPLLRTDLQLRSSRSRSPTHVCAAVFVEHPLFVDRI